MPQVIKLSVVPMKKLASLLKYSHGINLLRLLSQLFLSQALKKFVGGKCCDSRELMIVWISWNIVPRSLSYWSLYRMGTGTTDWTRRHKWISFEGDVSGPLLIVQLGPPQIIDCIYHGHAMIH